MATVATSGSYNDLLNKPTLTTDLVSLTDTTITTPSDAQVLTYDSVTSKWVNTDATSGEISSSSYTANGYVIMNDGMIIQWGTTGTVPKGTVNVTYPISFPNNVLAAQVSQIFTIDSGTFDCTINSKSATNLVLRNTSGYSTVLTWIAIGY